MKVWKIYAATALVQFGLLVTCFYGSYAGWSGEWTPAAFQCGALGVIFGLFAWWSYEPNK